MASAAVDAGGRLIAVRPEHIVHSERDIVPPGVEVVTTVSIRERKQVIDDASHAFVALPGGIGTLEELMEIMTLRQLGVHARPIYVLEIDRFWQPLIELFSNMVAAGVVVPEVVASVRFFTSVNELVQALDVAYDYCLKSLARTDVALTHIAR